MAFSSPGGRDQLLAQLADPRPTGLPIGTYATYREAQRAIDYLSDENFPVEHTTIVGNDLQRVEKITGRLTVGRAIMLGAGSGAYLGLFFGVLMSLLARGVGFFVALLTGIALGALMGAVFGLFGFLASRGQRDFTSSTIVIATTYDVLCEAQQAAEARNHLAKLALKGEVAPLVVERPTSQQPQTPTAPAYPAAPGEPAPTDQPPAQTSQAVADQRQSGVAGDPRETAPTDSGRPDADSEEG